MLLILMVLNPWWLKWPYLVTSNCSIPIGDLLWVRRSLCFQQSIMTICYLNKQVTIYIFCYCSRFDYIYFNHDNNNHIFLYVDKKKALIRALQYLYIRYSINKLITSLWTPSALVSKTCFLFWPLAPLLNTSRWPLTYFVACILNSLLTFWSDSIKMICFVSLCPW